MSAAASVTGSETVDVRLHDHVRLLAGILHMIVAEDRIDRAFLGEHAVDVEPALEALRAVPFEECVARCGVDGELVRR